MGINNVDLAAAQARGIVVTNTPGANSASVAELTVLLMLSLVRPVATAVTQTRQGGWPRLKGQSLVGKTVGLVGLGAIGKEVAGRLAGFDCTLLAFDVVADTAFAAGHNVQLVSLAELLAQVDIVSLHVPVLPATINIRIIADLFFGSRLRGRFLINSDQCPHWER